MRRLVALACVLACSTGREPLHRRRDPGALVVAQARDIYGLDPVRVIDNESIEVGELLFEGLVRWKPGTTDITPGLAAAWEVSPDGKRWTFHLRDQVTFHDGSPLDAAAVVFSFQRLLDAHHPSFIPGDDGNYWRGLFKVVTHVTAVDRSTVAIDIERPYAPLLGLLAMYPIVSPAAVSRWGEQFPRHPVGTGPYQFESWAPGEQVVVRRFESYWGKPPELSQIVFRVVVDARQRLVDLESGSVDLATAVLPDEQSFVELHPDLELHHTPGNDVSYLAFNMTRPPFDDLRVRRAINYGVNKDPIVKLAYQGRAVAADGPLPPTQWGYHEPKLRYPHDLVTAKKLLAEAMAARHLDPGATYTLYAPIEPRPYFAQPERVARFLQAELAQLGIKTEIRLQTFQQHTATVQAGQHDLALFGWIGDTGDPDNFLYVLFHSDNAVAGQAQNISFYRDPGVDKLLIEAQSTADEATRTGLYRVVQDRIAEDAPWVPIAHSELVVAGRAELRDVVMSPLGHPVYPLIRRAEVRP
jgi:peptide/nickel transport system substrate-binding protein